MTKPTPIDPKAGAAAYAVLEATLAAIPDDTVQSPRTDVQAAVVAALTLVPFLRQPRIREKLQLLPREVFDIAVVDGLETAAWCAWHCQSQNLTESASASDTRVAPAVVEGATALRARMTRLLDYWFADDEAVSTELASIRAGTGYHDLATDLTRLALLFDAHRSVIEADKKSYRKDDAKLARKLAEQIVGSLVESDSQGKVWRGRRDRAYTHLVTVFGEITATGAFLFRGTDDADRFDVSLAAAGRTRRRARPSPTIPPLAPPPPPTGDGANPSNGASAGGPAS